MAKRNQAVRVVVFILGFIGEVVGLGWLLASTQNPWFLMLLIPVGVLLAEVIYPVLY